MALVIPQLKAPLKRAWDQMENPVMGREFRARMRGGRTYVIQGTFTLVVMVAVLITYWALVSQSAPTSALNERAAMVGRAIWTWGCLIEAALLPLMVPAFTSGSITLEREREMLELLLLTRQSAAQICLGKLMAGVGLGLVLVLSSLPALSLALVLGGVAPSEIFACLCVLVTAVLVTGTLGLAASTIAPKTMTATVACYLLVGFAMIGAPVTTMILTSARGLTVDGGELGILVMIGACLAVAFPPAIGLSVVLVKLREKMRSKAATRTEWLLTGGLCWCALMAVLYVPGVTELLTQSGAMTMLHPVLAISGVMFPNAGPGTAGSAFAPHLWWISSATYTGASIWLFYIALLRVKRLRVS